MPPLDDHRGADIDEEDEEGGTYDLPARRQALHREERREARRELDKDEGQRLRRHEVR